MEAWENKLINSSEVATLYHEKVGKWLLLEVIKTGKNNRAELFKLLTYADTKDALHDYLMEDKNWNWNKKYIFVFADPEKNCEV